MIRIYSHEVTAITLGGKAVSAVYYGARLVWQAIRSCFGAGVWTSANKWVGSDGWKE